MKTKNYRTLSLFLLLSACGSGGSGKKPSNTNLTTAHKPALCENGDSRPEAVVNSVWSIVDPNTNQVNDAYQISITENEFVVYTRCEDSGLEVEVSVPYEINGKNFVVLASDTKVVRNNEGEVCELSVERSILQFGRDGNRLHFCSKEVGNLLYQKN